MSGSPNFAGSSAMLADDKIGTPAPRIAAARTRSVPARTRRA